MTKFKQLLAAATLAILFLPSKKFKIGCGNGAVIKTSPFATEGAFFMTLAI